jgi:transcriptional regulator with XRE-family HTH domain
MHPIELLCKEYNITRYALSKKSGIRESVFSNLVQKNSPIENVKLGTLLKIADALQVPIGDLIEKLLAYESNATMD